MKWIIDKSFSFCYGHRVHNQRLNTKFTESGDACLACRHLHGHEGLVKVFLEEDLDFSGELKEGKPISNVEKTGMVTDFKHLGWFKNFLDDTLDHKFIMDLRDPLFPNEFLELSNLTVDDKVVLTDEMGYANKNALIEMPEGYFIPDLTRARKELDQALLRGDLSQSEADAIFEKYEGAVFVDFVPTSENLSGWLLKVVQRKMKGLEGVKVKAVEYWETPKSHCRVEA